MKTSPRIGARARASALALACFAAAATPSRAAWDSGTQSVFATGAGERALAMGGAFVATGRDASALMWNPAGLAGISRAEFQAGQSGDLGLGMTESYAAIALPSWRWGAAGLSLRHFGAGGIERRDARNVLLARDLTDSELEMAFGYAWRAGDAWNVGGAVKLQHQSLAGYSGSGVGLDLGFSGRPAAAFAGAPDWLQSIRYGLSIRNALEPTIRLDRENVKDPLAMRGGLAWEGLLPSGGGLVAEVDLARSGDVLRPHAGLEYRPLPAAALLVGTRAGALTAGTTFRWHDLTVSYAFEDNPLGESHRAGIRYGFGLTTDASRERHRRREDERLEARLGDAFRSRQAEQVSGLLAQARAAREQGDPATALEKLAWIQTLEPDHAEAAALEIGCLADRARAIEHGGDFAGAVVAWENLRARAPHDTAAAAGALRCRAESDRRARRHADIRERFARGLDALAGEDLAAAREHFAAVLRLDPQDAEAARMLDRTEQALARRARLQAEQVARAEQARRAAEASRRRAAADSGSTAPPPAAPALGDREVEDLYRRGAEALRAQRPDDALRYWELVWSARPTYREVATWLEREYLTRGMESFAAGRFDDAVDQWQRVLRIDPADERARGYLDRALKQRERSREILGVGP